MVDEVPLALYLEEAPPAGRRLAMLATSAAAIGAGRKVRRRV